MEINTTLFDYKDYINFISKTTTDRINYKKAIKNPELFYEDYLNYKKEEFLKKYEFKCKHKIKSGD